MLLFLMLSLTGFACGGNQSEPDPAPSEPAPSEPAPAEPAPVEPAPAEPADAAPLAEPGEPAADCAEPPGRMCCQAMTPSCEACQKQARAEYEAWQARCQP